MNRTGDPTSRRTRSAEPPTGLEEFASLVAHELMTPLAIITTAAETALRLGPSDPDQQRSLLEMIRRNSEHAGLVMRRLAMLHDLTDGQVELHRTKIDLGELVRAAVEDIHTVRLRDLDVEVIVCETAVIEADEPALREIMFNLLANAAKHSAPDLPIHVDVDVVGGAAQVVVADHGCGVEPGDSERIFEAFFQLDPDAPGVGLGLFVSRGLARAHGGELAVQPGPDGGSEFHLRLPLAAP